ncbi:MAG: UDP-N-acetylmuramoyl-L-alanine--D-glutamate ligase [Bacteroidota bacterium]|nr:UDP-N-acetylmuramoyl-L-alanine--D-glutamate ligase [Bacteroidota bacterium]
MTDIVVLGAARSGRAAACLAQRLGASVFVSEQRAADLCSEAVEQFSHLGIPAEFGGHSERVFRAAQIIISPGIPPHAPVVQEARRRGIPILSELEFAWRHLSQRTVVAVTGTNGKTTTTALIGFILRRAGREGLVGSNIGTPLSELMCRGIPDGAVLVLEVSSYQLEFCHHFRPDVAVLLNIVPDHLEYHGGFEAYRQAKWRITAQQRPQDLLILNADDREAKAAEHRTRARCAYFGMRPVAEGAYIRGTDVVTVWQHKEEVLMSTDKLRLPGAHNLYNSLAAVVAARALEIRNEDIRDSLMQFAGVEHRLELVRRWRGVDFINDSKATNVNAAWYALSSYTQPIVWIAGGRGEHNDYSSLDELVSQRVRLLIAIGEEADALFGHFYTKVRCLRATSLREAVRLAALYAQPGDVVLLSPACKSFDMFVNFEHRGEVFRQAVWELPE